MPDFGNAEAHLLAKCFIVLHLQQPLLSTKVFAFCE